MKKIAEARKAVKLRNNARKFPRRNNLGTKYQGNTKLTDYTGEKQ